eukprot:TRINITY_DN14498_c0_g1_i1.p1 TRINITY_DN14498_c0_g1~~TRINITY_DN14498_c0_g1_i1.p1  ORF type:complete len:162 (-),score=41.00 TRINITY_DN14498_c0_g1_i1:19-504(-)
MMEGIGVFLISLALSILKAFNHPIANKRGESYRLEIKRLQKLMRQYDSIDTFVQKSKIERKINLLTEALSKIPEDQPSKIPFYLSTLSSIVSLVLFWETPMFVFSRDVFSLGFLLSFPHDGYAVGIFPWLVICHVVSEQLLRFLFTPKTQSLSPLTSKKTN